MKKFYEDPEIQIRNYKLLSRDIVMTSDLNDDDEYPYTPYARSGYFPGE